MAATAALNREHVVDEKQTLQVRFERALLQPIRRVVDQLAGGLHGSFQHRQELLFDEAHLPVMPVGEQVHDPVQIIVRQNQQGNECAPSHGFDPRADFSAGLRQKSKKLNQLNGSRRQCLSSNPA